MATLEKRDTDYRDGGGILFCTTNTQHPHSWDDKVTALLVVRTAMVARLGTVALHYKEE